MKKALAGLLIFGMVFSAMVVPALAAGRHGGGHHGGCYRNSAVTQTGTCPWSGEDCPWDRRTENMITGRTFRRRWGCMWFCGCPRS